MAEAEGGYAVVSSWAAWPVPVAILVTVLVVLAAVTQGPRWSWLASRRDPTAA
ncbi:hypothetical protein [Planotetraspora sp. GP83]|uniref:hypothetical protein n=1 Tax=Planotetraspora sp. GP83 TaxID=3156264 RepID=UPI003519B54C